MRLVFIADSHAKGPDDPSQKQLSRFLEELSDNPPKRLVILGDLFDFWIGTSGLVYYRYLPVLTPLVKLRKLGTEITYLEGNHDFSLGPFFTEFLGAEVHPDSTELSIDGKRIFLSHGDIVDRSIRHRIWRWFLRSPFVKALVTMLPAWVLFRMASALSRKSRTYRECAPQVEKALKDFATELAKSNYDGCVMA
ncbi:MAG: UDP-2,3-diacylglucosamine diphosphatase, partial [Thermodesulfobacteriota bacterium]